MKTGTAKPVRCAIYTRVSTDQGLEQDFNSLNAQRDAAEAYIRSQAHAAWTLIRGQYNDGGYSGVSTDRPALQRLLADIRAKKVDIIVVYPPLGQPSIDPVLMIRMLIIGYVFALRSERLLCREVHVNFAYRHARIVRYSRPHRRRALTSCDQGAQKVAFSQV